MSLKKKILEKISKTKDFLEDVKKNEVPEMKKSLTDFKDKIKELDPLSLLLSGLHNIDLFDWSQKIIHSSKDLSQKIKDVDKEDLRKKMEEMSPRAMDKSEDFFKAWEDLKEKRESDAFSEEVVDFVDRADSGQGVADPQVVVEEPEWQAGDEGVYPDRQAGEFDGDRVEVATEHASAGDQASQDLGVVDPVTIGELAELVYGGCPEGNEFSVDGADRVLDEELRERCFEMIDGCDEEVSRSHGEVRAPELEQPLGGACLVTVTEEN